MIRFAYTSIAACCLLLTGWSQTNAWEKEYSWDGAGEAVFSSPNLVQGYVLKGEITSGSVHQVAFVWELGDMQQLHWKVGKTVSCYRILKQDTVILFSHPAPEKIEKMEIKREADKYIFLVNGNWYGSAVCDGKPEASYLCKFDAKSAVCIFTQEQISDSLVWGDRQYLERQTPYRTIYTDSPGFFKIGAKNHLIYSNSDYTAARLYQYDFSDLKGMDIRVRLNFKVDLTEKTGGFGIFLKDVSGKEIAVAVTADSIIAWNEEGKDALQLGKVMKDSLSSFSIEFAKTKSAQALYVNGLRIALPDNLLKWEPGSIGFINYAQYVQIYEFSVYTLLQQAP